MPKKVLGKARYTASRLAGVLELTAIGETPNLNDKVDFEQLPFLILPPMFAFFFIHSDISLPAVRPFSYSEDIPFYPKSARFVRIQDAEGFHDVAISEVVVPPIDATSAAPAANAGGYCVFSWIGINPMMIAKRDALVPAVYTKVFGPATYEECAKYIKDNGGIA